jgi:sulfur carrier protein
LTIRLNGEPFDVTDPATIGTLLDLLDLDARRVAVEHNLLVVRRDAYGTTPLKERDEVEIVNFVGGG